jgi:epsilon-lactone hydrolase
MCTLIERASAPGQAPRAATLASVAGLPYLARQVPQLVSHAQRVAKRRREHGPLLPGWEWQYEVFLAYFRERFNETHLSPATIRANFDTIGRLSPDLPLVEVRSVDAYGVPGSIFSDSRLSQLGRRPSARWLLYLHGGAYVFGSARSHAPLLARLARITGVRVLAVDYRLAPEHPHPAALDDALTAWRWLLDQGVRPDQVTIAGDSAGGGLTLATLLALRDADRPRPGRAVLLSPWTDLALTGDSVGQARHDYLPDPEHLRTFAGHYHGELDPRDPLVSPLYASELRELPPMLTLAGGEEAILDDSTRMHERLREAGVAAQLHVEEHEVHVYPMFASVSRRGRDGVRRIAEFIG